MFIAKIFLFGFNFSMGLAESLKRVCIKLGENNKPTYAVMAIAAVKGIARPTFTMMDKHEDPETKKYTALREGLTEVVAIPAYWGCGELASKIAGKMKLSPEKQALAKHNFMFMGVCTAALFVIPALASLAIKPFMKTVMGDKMPEKKKKLDIKENIVDEKPIEISIHKPQEYSQPYYSYSMANYKPDKFGDLKVGASW